MYWCLEHTENTGWKQRNEAGIMHSYFSCFKYNICLHPCPYKHGDMKSVHSASLLCLFISEDTFEAATPRSSHTLRNSSVLPSTTDSSKNKQSTAKFFDLGMWLVPAG